MTRTLRRYGGPLALATVIFVTPASAQYGARYDNRSAYVSSLAPPMPDRTAHVRIEAPPDAKIWFGDALMASTGQVHDFKSPPLKPFVRYTYDVKVRWTENGREVTQSKRIPVAAGDYAAVKFPVPPPRSVVATASAKR